jgi:hypothetical protein
MKESKMISGETDGIGEGTHRRIPISFRSSALFPKQLFLSVTEERIINAGEVVSGVWGINRDVPKPALFHLIEEEDFLFKQCTGGLERVLLEVSPEM